MAQKILSISLREARKAYWALVDNSELYSKIQHGFSEVYYLPEYDENNPEDVENHEQLVADLECLLRSAGVTEFEFGEEVVL